MFSQVAKENSQQIQIERFLNIGAIDESTAIKIFTELYNNTRVMLTKEANDIAKNRVVDFENVLMRRISETIGNFSMFRVPWFYIQLVEAQKAAAISGLFSSYDLLATLLLNKYIEDETRLDSATSIINQAIKVVKNISLQTLEWFTVVCSLHYIYARKCKGVLETIEAYEDRYNKLITTNPPEDTSEFLNEIQILKLCRAKVFKTRPCFEENFFNLHYRNLIETGIKKDSNNFILATQYIKNANFHEENIFIEHELNFDYMRLNLRCIDDVDNLEYSDQQKNVLKTVFGLYVFDESIINENLLKLNQLWLERPILKKASDFVNSVPCLTETYVGIRIARANLQRLNAVN